MVRDIIYLGITPFSKTPSFSYTWRGENEENDFAHLEGPAPPDVCCSPSVFFCTWNKILKMNWNNTVSWSSFSQIRFSWEKSFISAARLASLKTPSPTSGLSFARYNRERMTTHFSIGAIDLVFRDEFGVYLWDSDVVTLTSVPSVSSCQLVVICHLFGELDFWFDEVASTCPSGSWFNCSKKQFCGKNC